MAQLMTLSNELLFLVFIAAPTIQMAARLSVNRRLRNVWLNNNDRIITAILKPEIPAYEDAAALAMTEACFLSPVSSDSAPDNPRPPPYLWLPRLLRNAELASYACAMQNTFIQGLPEGNYRLALTFTSFFTSYYMIRQLVLAYNYPRLQPALRSKLEAASTNTLRTHYELCLSMCEFMDEEEQARQGLLKDEEDWTGDDELHATVVKEDWEFALDVMSQVLEKRIHE
jgi:hypothetical protein